MTKYAIIKLQSIKGGMYMQRCMECNETFNNDELTWINDNYGIPFKKVCDACYQNVIEEIQSNNYGDELSNYEIYGEE